MRADRLLSILLLLQVHRRLTARELAGRLEVSERTIYRDMDALSAAGVPVMAERGSAGGWEVLEAYKANLTGLNALEIQALFLAGPARVLADLGLERAFEAAGLKLLAALPAMYRGDAEAIRQRIYIDVAGWHRTAEEGVPFLAMLQAAIWQERQLRIAYERGGDDAQARVVDPLGLVAKGSVWYLVAAVEGEPRTYRVSRIQHVEVTGEPAIRPPGFDLAAYWEASKDRFVAALPRYPATVRAHADVAGRLAHGGHFVRVDALGEPDAAGWVTVKLRCETLWEASAYVLSFGPQMEVVEPEELRARVRDKAAQIVALYAAREQSPQP